MAVSVATIIRHVLVDGLAVVGAGEPVKPADAIVVLDAINGVLDDWSADVQTSVAGVVTPFTTQAIQPHTIGPTGTWVLPVRPVKVDGLAVALSSGVFTIIDVSDDPRWWLARQATGGAGAYYAAEVPDGALSFASGAPTAGLDVLLLTRWVLGSVLHTASLVLPPGYQSALELTVMEACVDAFHATLTANQIRRAGLARARIFANNLRIPSLSAAGLGLPGMTGGRWDARTGTWSGGTTGGFGSGWVE